MTFFGKNKFFVKLFFEFFKKSHEKSKICKSGILSGEIEGSSLNETVLRVVRSLTKEKESPFNSKEEGEEGKLKAKTCSW
jgi:hypothetical protein|uniref:Uncharacterized protein n=1 Tax=viral metagenome TaxID=1070528 RepID=A0A6C0BJV4_9ZZZZ